MRVFLASVALLCAGCSPNLYNTERELAVSMCEPNGGVAYITPWSLFSGVDVTCQNGAKFSKIVSKRGSKNDQATNPD